MAGTVSGLHRFADDVGPIPLALLDGNYNALQTALNTLETFSNFYLDTGTINNINVVTDPTQYASYADGLTVLVRIANTNTGAATLNINSMGAKPILDSNNNPTTANELVAGRTVEFVYSAYSNAFAIIGGTGGAVLMGDTAPANPFPGQFWFNSATGRLAIWYEDVSGGQWVAIGCGGGVTSGNIFAPPFTVGGPGHACLQVNTDCSTSLGNGLTMDASGHTWLYQGITTYPEGGLSGNGNSVRVHGNQTDTNPWLTFVNDSPAGVETQIGGIGGGSIFPIASDGSALNPQTMQFLAPAGFAFGVAQGGIPCMTIGPDCVVTFRQGPIVPNPTGPVTQQAASADWVTQQIEASLNPPGGTSLAQNGYITISGGLLMQWGSFAFYAGPTQPVTYPKAFAHATLNIQLSITSDTSGQDVIPRVYHTGTTASGFIFAIDMFGGTFNAPQTVYWLAIGY